MSEEEERATSIPGLAHGQVCYLQLPAADIDASARFYERVFGWKIDPPESGFEAPGLIGQWVTDRPASPDAGLLAWVWVDDIDRTLHDVTAAGGEIRDSPVPDGPRWLATFTDPGGNLIGIAQHGEPRSGATA
jgi:predicted enzyme related to lactoylglutathione lyase